MYTSVDIYNTYEYSSSFAVTRMSVSLPTHVSSYLPTPPSIYLSIPIYLSIDLSHTCNHGVSTDIVVAAVSVLFVLLSLLVRCLFGFGTSFVKGLKFRASYRKELIN